MGIEEQKIPEDFPGKVIPAGNGANVIVTSLDKIINWGRSNSLWSLYFGTSCCAIDMMQTGASRHDYSRFGFEVARRGGTTGVVLNAANEAAVAAFLEGKIGFLEIVQACREILNHHQYQNMHNHHQS